MPDDDSHARQSAFVERLNAVAEASSISGAWEAANGYFAALGFSRQDYGLTRFRFEHSTAAPDDALHLSTGGTEHHDVQFQGGHYTRTPIYRWTMSNVGACTWRWVDQHLAQGLLSPSEEEAVQFNSKMGIKAGISISFAETNQRVKGVLGLTADPGIGHDEVDAIWAKSGPQITALAQMLHLKISSLPMQRPEQPLTTRQREALEWVADGKTTQDVAILMGISAAMVEKHLRLARAALEVETTAQAIAKCTLLNMIFAR